MIKKIEHLSDIHIRKIPTRNDEYKQVFDKVLVSLRKSKPDRIVITGDFVNDYLDLQGEQLVLGAWFLNELAKIAKVIITRGNHDYRKSTANRIDSVDALTQSIANPNIVFLNETSFSEDDNVVWCTWKHGEKNNSPWVRHKKTFERDSTKTYIDLIHDTINGSINVNGFENNSPTNISLSEIMGDFAFLGHIHKKQVFFKDKKSKIPFAAYPSSLIPQKFDEGDDEFHGYLLWDIENKKIDEVEITCDYTYKNVYVNQFTDYDDLDIDIPDTTKFMKVRVNWKTLPGQRNKDNERKIVKYLKDKYQDVSQDITVSHVNKFIKENKISDENEINVSNIADKSIQHNIFVEYLTEIGIEQDIIDEILIIDNDITNRIELDEHTNIEWEIIKFYGKNFCSYEDINIDWRDKNGLIQITGLNTGGKTTILKLLSYISFGKTLETEKRKANGDRRYINNRNGATSTTGGMVISAMGEYYGIERTSTLGFDKQGEVNKCPTTLKYHKLNSPDDEFSDDNDIEKLTEDIRAKTQKTIDKIIGSYDNFMRAIMTTSDTLNRILSVDSAVFTDSLLYDSGLDIFDKKTNAFKDYQKEVNNKQLRITCDIPKTEEKIVSFELNNKNLENHNKIITETNIKIVKQRIVKAKDYIETKTKSLHKIDSEIYTLDKTEVLKTIEIHKQNIVGFDAEKQKLNTLINGLISTYDEKSLTEKIEFRDKHKQAEFDLKTKKSNIDREKTAEIHKIALLNGEIQLLKNQGASKRVEHDKLLNSKVCPTCHQDLKEEQKLIIDKQALSIMTDMKKLGADIKDIENVKITAIKEIIKQFDLDMIAVDEEIKAKTKEMETILVEIGNLTNQKNDVETRKKHQADVDAIPLKIENEKLKSDLLKSKIEKYELNLNNISENKIIESKIDRSKKILNKLESQELKFNEIILNNNNSIKNNKNLIVELEQLIKSFKEQERLDLIYKIYKDCVHRDGIPKQMLGKYIIPRANELMEELLSNSAFSVWLDSETITLKFKYNNQDNSTSDAIECSGKERTIASIILKYALNGINSKSKPSMLILDEVMGKLIGDSIEEFTLILHEIKKQINKIIIIEHNHDIDPDFIISVTKDKNDISSAEIMENY